MSRSATARQPEPEVAEAFRIIPLEAPLGAEVRGLDARRPLVPEQALALKQVLREHRILVFRQQHLDDEQYLCFAALFGLVFQPSVDIPVLSSGGDGRAPDIVKVVSTGDGELGNFALSAHIDHRWAPVPSSGPFLYALGVPSSGGETRFTNPVHAYESLNEATRREIDGLRLINHNSFTRLREGDYDGGFTTYRTPDIEPIQGSEHSLVHTHPENGRRVPLLSAHTEVEIPGYDPMWGQALIGRLREHLARPKLSYSHAWPVDDIVWWDDQAVLHARNTFLVSERRCLKCISLAGSRPF